MNETENLRARIAHLEDRLETIETAHSVEDESGQKWSVPDLLELGLTRRQAIKAIGALALYGGSIWAGIEYATRDAAAATDQVGTQSRPVDVFADSITTEEGTVTNAPSAENEIARLGDVASSKDDLSDVTVHHQKKRPTSTTDYNLFSVTNGPKVMLNVNAAGYYFQAPSTQQNYSVELDVDGVTDNAYPSADDYVGQTSGNNNNGSLSGYPVQYDSSLQLDWRHSGSGLFVTVAAFIIGSGPHNAAIVQDGEPVYSIHRNLNDDQIEDLEPPSGYKVIKNPEIAHSDPMNRGMWDDANETVRDHDYYKPAYDALDNLQELASHFGRETVQSSWGTMLDGVSLPNPQNGATPFDSSSSTPKADAAAFLDQQWSDELPSSI